MLSWEAGAQIFCRATLQNMILTRTNEGAFMRFIPEQQKN